MVPFLRGLPSGDLDSRELLVDGLLLAEEGRLRVYWIPFERLNVSAGLIIVGLTPGLSQMQKAFIAGRDALQLGMTRDEALVRVDRAASFAGAMRLNMVRMLDMLGMPAIMNIASTADLFGSSDFLVHTTSALRYPVFVDGKNYGGGSPPVNRSRLLSGYVTETLGPELAAVPDGLVLPLGKATEGCLRMLVGDGVLDEARCLFGFPHPSGGNGHRVRQFRENEEQLRLGIKRWASRSA